jgi:hypothetical protein
MTSHSTNFRVLIVLVSSLTLTACGDGSSSTATEESTSNSAPTASSVSISDGNGGSAEMGDTLTGNYTYADVDSDSEGISIFRWLRDGTAISGATKSTYNIIASDANASLTFEVTPIAAAGTITGSAVTSSAITIAAISKLLNDTGIISCGDYAYTDSGTSYDITGSGTYNNSLDCSVQATVPTQTTDGYDSDGDIIRAGQDALYGRDVTHNDDSDGHAGFSFSKLDSSGIALTDQTVAWDAGGSEVIFSQWSCVKDNVTGLTWEVKNTSGLQASTYTYTWYNSTNANDGGDHGIGDTGVGTTTGYELTAGAQAGSDNCLTSSRCDTEKYVADVNASNSSAGICGATDWRLPTKHELNSIVKNSTINPVIDAIYFPNTQSNYYWSSSPYAGNNYSAWYVYFYNGSVSYSDKDGSGYVRLVRGSQ